MRRQWKKIALALAISATCFGITQALYVLTAPKPRFTNQEPIAYVSKISDEVLRRPVAHMIWQILEQGQPVYPGEAVRTSSLGEVSLEFTGNHRQLDLESDTLIVLTKSKDEISMELLDGGAFVSQNLNESKEGGKLTLTSSDGKVDLSHATASLSKSKDKGLDLKVLEGEARVDRNGKSESLNKPNNGLGNLKIISPRLDEVVYSPANLTRPVSFQWQGLPADWKVSLLVGSQRKNLKSVAATEGKKSDLRVDLKPGHYAWKLAVKDAQGLAIGESAVFKFEVASLLAPSPLAPVNNKVLLTRVEKMPLEFRWASAPDSQGTLLEISKTPQFTELLKTATVSANVGESKLELGAGVYFWRLSALYQEGRPKSTSLTQKFEIVYKPPKVVKLAWDGKLKTQQFFVTDPSLALKWTTNEPTEVAKYRVTILRDRSPADATPENSPVTLELGATEVAAKVKEQGHFSASVEALDAQGEVVAKTDPVSINLEVQPLLAAPQFQPLEGDLHASPRGDLDLQWKVIEGAKNYFVTLKDSVGNPIQNKMASQNTLHLSRMMPGIYDAEIYAIDSYGRKSEQEKPRRIVVPDKSGLSAPRLKKVKVN